MCVVYLYHCSGLFRFLVLSFHFKIFVFVLRKPRNWSTVTIPPCSLVTHPLCSPKYVRQQCVHTGSNALSQGTGSPLWAQSLSLSFFFFLLLLFIDLLMDSRILSWFGKWKSQITIHFNMPGLSLPHNCGVCSSLVFNQSKLEWKTALKNVRLLSIVFYLDSYQSLRNT